MLKAFCACWSPARDHDRTHDKQKIILFIYVDSSCICGYACAHTSAHRIAYTHPNEPNKRISERTKRASEPSELNESDESYYLKRIKQTTTSDILQCRMMSLNHIGYTRHKDDITNNQSRMSQPHQMNGQIITD